jgi:DNA gyrase/topoisomerase IV subunit B
MSEIKKEQYNEKTVRVLETVEAIRINPGMYVGSADEQG